MLKLRDIMTTPVAEATSDMTLRDALEMLSDKLISGAPVVDNGKVKGVFSSTDLLSFIAEMDDSQPAVTFREGRTQLEEASVADLMTREVHSLGPECSVELAAEFMRRLQIHRVLVIEDGELVGIVTTTDLARAVAEHRFNPRRSAFVSQANLSSAAVNLLVPAVGSSGTALRSG